VDVTETARLLSDDELVRLVRRQILELGYPTLDLGARAHIGFENRRG
jgi:hypothetical protein